MGMKHGYWNPHNKASFEARNNAPSDAADRQTAGHVSHTRIKRLRAAMVFIRDHAPDIATRLYAESALESDDVLS